MFSYFFFFFFKCKFFDGFASVFLVSFNGRPMFFGGIRGEFFFFPKVLGESEKNMKTSE